MSTFSEINSAIQKRCRERKHPGVVAFRPGYKFTSGWITDKSAIVLIVDGKRDDIRQGGAQDRWGRSGPPWCNQDHRVWVWLDISSGFIRLGAHGETKVALRTACTVAGDHLKGAVNEAG